MEEFSDIPANLKRDLKAASPRLPIPALRDAAIKSAARPLLRRRLLVWRSTAMIAAAAAVIAITLILLVDHDWSAKKPPAPGVAKIPNDMNGDGVVDICDALLVAQKTKDGQTIPAPWNNAVTLSNADLKNITDQIVTVPPAGNAAASFKHPLAVLDSPVVRVTR